jgi:hypothetical protein
VVLRCVSKNTPQIPDSAEMKIISPTALAAKRPGIAPAAFLK